MYCSNPRTALLVLVMMLWPGTTVQLSALPGDNAPSTAVMSADGQQGQPSEYTPVPGTLDEYYLTQRTPDGQLVLTANEAFFPRLGLTAAGKGDFPDSGNLNGGNSFARISRWDTGDVAEWGILFSAAGHVQVQVRLSAEETGGQFTIRLGDSSRTIAADLSAGDSSDKSITAELNCPAAGFQTLQLTCEQPVDSAEFHELRLSGPPVQHAAVVRKRWRPAAAHTRFTSSQSTGPIRLWVMEMDAVPGPLGFYSPITTPFGYYGPTWQADGSVNSSFNFSLWSFGRNEQEPPLEQLSHLLAIGHPTASFGGFGHEGTGVKIRDWEPLAGQQGQQQVIALRAEPGPMYDTYYSYFYSTREQRWRLFGVGNKYNAGKPLHSLWTGSFVEVPGPPAVQRTGAYERTMRYRGWAMQRDGTWHTLDQMANGNVERQTGLTHTHRGVTDDGWFFLKTGGWMFRKPAAAEVIRLPEPTQAADMDYLSQAHLQTLLSVPSEITLERAELTAGTLQGTYQIRNAADQATVIAYWGSQEALTLADRWEHSRKLTTTREGQNNFTLQDIGGSGPVFVRLLLQNSAGQFWSTATFRVTR